MIDVNDFKYKQILVVFFNNGEKLSFLNDNVIIKDSENKIKHQSTCYRLFAIFIIGNTNITTGLIERSRRFGFAIALFNTYFRLYELIGAKKDSNTLLHRAQYVYESLDIARYITKNKINNQYLLINAKRGKSSEDKESLTLLAKYIKSLDNAESLSEIMGFEGIASKVYFKNFFNNINWLGRKPRIKCDYVNSLLDIGYTVLFSFIDVMLSIYGFDVYCGVMHTCFYMRKSLVCDIIEPFRSIIDQQTKKSINLKQFQESDFTCNNGRFELSWKHSPNYLSIYLNAILSRKIEIFKYVQSYYRAFMRNKPIENFPIFTI